MKSADIVIIGAGIVGAATAYRLIQMFPNRKILLVEKELQAGLHQTGRNSGVVHAGVYYQPGSLKATLCREGLDRTLAFCRQYGVDYQQCGKLIVATDDIECQRLDELYQRCLKNSLSPQRISREKLAVIEPHITGKEAILIQQTSITNYAEINKRLIQLFEQAGGKTIFGFELLGVESEGEQVILAAENNKLTTDFYVNCAGLMSDKIAKLTNANLDYRIIPFKGEYFQLPASLNKMIKHLIYPVPDPKLPFLGVHLTKMIDASITVGPNAVLAGAREGYGKFGVNLTELSDLLKYKGFWKLLTKQKASVYNELKSSFFVKSYLRNIQKYCPNISLSDLRPFRCGIRAQAVNMDGELIHDFKFLQEKQCLHVCNAPSPAATSAMPIADIIAEKVYRAI